MARLKVIDLFCGAGGFSEGFRQQGFEILLGIDYWEPAIKTFEQNFKAKSQKKDIRDFLYSIEEINNIPNSDIIIGSPPCVSFSNSNRSGKAEKGSGIELTEAFLRVIAVKKHQENSELKAWFMENVPNSMKYLKKSYTFLELNLGDWASENEIDPLENAINLEGNYFLVNSADFGSPQFRKRLIAGEVLRNKKIELPPNTHKDPNIKGRLPKYITVRQILDSLPSPFSKQKDRIINDPLYPEIKILERELSDHFYDTGLYKCEWKQSQFLKTNHPYMGRMSFPEKIDRPSRTITATKIGTSREALIFKSELDRKGNGEYRTPTIREAACFMGFPITFQFFGSEGTKWRLVGNGVCPSVSRALAKYTRKELGMRQKRTPIIVLEPKPVYGHNLNTYSEKSFENKPRRNKGSRFRRHPFKDGNITVTLSNYDISKKEKNLSKWFTSVQYGNGEGFPTFNYQDEIYKHLAKDILMLPKGKSFLKKIQAKFQNKIGNSTELQEMYESQKSKNGFIEPTILIEKVCEIIESFNFGREIFHQNGQIIFPLKNQVPLKQLLALYAINLISTTANNSNSWKEKKELNISVIY